MSGAADIDGVPIDETKLKASAASPLDLDGIPLPSDSIKSSLFHEDYDGELIAGDIDGVAGIYANTLYIVHCCTVNTFSVE